MRLGYIYALADPDTSEVRYVGKTIMTPEIRLKKHIKRAKDGAPAYVYRWMRTLSVPPLVIPIEVIPVDELNDAERHWIFIMKRLGVRLTNLTDGGDGGAMQGEALEKLRNVTRSPETRAQIAETLRGRKLSPEHRANIAAGLRGKKHPQKKQSPESRAKAAESNRGKKRTPEQRAAMSETQQKRKERDGYMNSPETRIKISNGNKGRKQPPEAIEKSAAARRGMKRSAETRTRISQSQRGKTHSAETRALISESSRGRVHSPETRMQMSSSQRERRANERRRRTLIITRIMVAVSTATIITITG